MAISSTSSSTYVSPAGPQSQTEIEGKTVRNKLLEFVRWICPCLCDKLFERAAEIAAANEGSEAPPLEGPSASHDIGNEPAEVIKFSQLLHQLALALSAAGRPGLRSEIDVADLSPNGMTHQRNLVILKERIEELCGSKIADELELSCFKPALEKGIPLYGKGVAVEHTAKVILRNLTPARDNANEKNVIDLKFCNDFARELNLPPFDNNMRYAQPSLINGALTVRIGAKYGGAVVESLGDKFFDTIGATLLGQENVKREVQRVRDAVEQIRKRNTEAFYELFNFENFTKKIKIGPGLASAWDNVVAWNAICTVFKEFCTGDLGGNAASKSRSPDRNVRDIMLERFLKELPSQNDGAFESPGARASTSGPSSLKDPNAVAKLIDLVMKLQLEPVSVQQGWTSTADVMKAVVIAGVNKKYDSVTAGLLGDNENWKPDPDQNPKSVDQVAKVISRNIRIAREEAGQKPTTSDIFNEFLSAFLRELGLAGRGHAGQQTGSNIEVLKIIKAEYGPHVAKIVARIGALETVGSLTGSVGAAKAAKRIATVIRGVQQAIQKENIRVFHKEFMPALVQSPDANARHEYSSQQAVRALSYAQNAKTFVKCKELEENCSVAEASAATGKAAGQRRRRYNPERTPNYSEQDAALLKKIEPWAATQKQRRGAITRITRCLSEREQTLDLSNMDLTSVPAELGSLTWLTNLDLSNNQIKTLPDEFKPLFIKLKTLNLEGNQLTEIPVPEQNKIPLKTLYLGRNLFRNIPKEIIQRMPQGFQVVLGNNPIDATEIAAFEKSCAKLPMLVSRTRDGIFITGQVITIKPVSAARSETEELVPSSLPPPAESSSGAPPPPPLPPVPRTGSLTVPQSKPKGPPPPPRNPVPPLPTGATRAPGAPGLWKATMDAISDRYSNPDGLSSQKRMEDHEGDEW